MSVQYDDLLFKPYPFPTKRKKMSMVDRAAQFSPFAALTGYDAAIRETGRLTDQQVVLDVDAEALLNEKLRLLYELQQENPEICLTYFVPDTRKCGGAYETLSGTVRKVSPQQQAIVLADGQVVYFSRIRDIQGEIFRQIEGLYFFG